MPIDIKVNVTLSSGQKRVVRAAVVGGAVLAAFSVSVALAAPRNTFANGQPLASQAMNENFTDLDKRIGALEAQHVASPGTSKVSIASAFIDVSGTTYSVGRADGGWIAAVNRTALGEVTVLVVPGTFSSAPNCVAGIQNTGGFAWVTVLSTSTTAVGLTILSNPATNTVALDKGFSLVCVGSR